MSDKKEELKSCIECVKRFRHGYSEGVNAMYKVCEKAITDAKNQRPIMIPNTRKSISVERIEEVIHRTGTIKIDGEYSYYFTPNTLAKAIKQAIEEGE